jgi:outer membrane receptor protein involved in Fe transport
VGRYDRLSTTEPGQPQVLFAPSPHVLVTAQFGNQLKATTQGFEVSANLMPIPAWRVDGSYSAFLVTPHLAATSLDTGAAQADASSPRRQWQLRSVVTPHDRATLAFMIFHTGPLEQYQVSAYTRADITAEWRFTDHLSAMAIGQNLADASHPEFSTQGTLLLATEVPRNVALRLRWTFQ